MGPIFENAAIFGEEFAEHLRREVRLASPDDMVVRALDDGNGVDLHITEVLNDLPGSFLAAAD